MFFSDLHAHRARGQSIKGHSQTVGSDSKVTVNKRSKPEIRFSTPDVVTKQHMSDVLFDSPQILCVIQPKACTSVCPSVREHT